MLEKRSQLAEKKIGISVITRSILAKDVDLAIFDLPPAERHGKGKVATGRRGGLAGLCKPFGRRPSQ